MSIFWLPCSRLGLHLPLYYFHIHISAVHIPRRPILPDEVAQFRERFLSQSERSLVNPSPERIQNQPSLWSMLQRDSHLFSQRKRQISGSCSHDRSVVCSECHACGRATVMDGQWIRRIGTVLGRGSRKRKWVFHVPYKIGRDRSKVWTDYWKWCLRYTLFCSVG